MVVQALGSVQEGPANASTLPFPRAQDHLGREGLGFSGRDVS